MTSYFLYARKSTDVEDKQVRSIEDQLSVLRALARQEKLHIIGEFIEKQSAKMPGRPVFNGMMNKIEQGEAQGILCWKLDRLARNPMDAARVQWLLQQDVIKRILTSDRSYYPSDNVLMIGVEFGMANQYIRDLSANTKRGLHEKAKRGEYPSVAPLGYMNDVRVKRIVVDEREAAIVREAFELYSRNQSRLEDISKFLFDNGVKTKASNRWMSEGGRAWKRDQITAFLSNPFYCGLFRYAGELYEGKHEPIISKQLFDKVQSVLKERSKPQVKTKQPKPLCGLFRCGECGRMITAEFQKGRTYYRCSKKGVVCSQPYIREEVLSDQLSSIFKEFKLPSDWAAELYKLADKDEQEAARSPIRENQTLRSEIASVTEKLQRLFDAYLEQDIERNTYRSEKAKLLLHKRSLEEKMAGLNRGYLAWLEPLRGWIEDAANIGETAVSTDLTLKKSLAQKISGSNAVLKNRRIEFTPTPPYASLREARLNFSNTDLVTPMVLGKGFEPAFLSWQNQCPTVGRRARELAAGRISVAKCY
jgi:site-specific DNA recombinase